jgi:hypothetical protein
MNKLFKAGLAVLAIALLTSSALAYSPTWTTVPDVIVGDGDLVFTNAFNWADYVSDADTTSPSLQLVFAEGPWDTGVDRADEVTDGSSSNEVQINSKTEVDYSGKGNVEVSAPITFDGTTILGSTGWLTFTESSGADRAVVLIASDGSTTPTASNAFRVREDAGVPDQLTSVVGKTQLGNWDTDGDFGDWVFTALTAPTSVSGGGSVGITTSDATANDFAFWQLKPSATHITMSPPGQIIRGRWTINGGSAAINKWPAINMRFLENNNTELSWSNVSFNGYVPDPGNSRTYETFYEPAIDLPSTDLSAAFYVIDTDTNTGGTFSLEQLEVDGLTGVANLATNVQTIDSGQSVDFTSVVPLTFSSDVTDSGNADSFTWTVNGLTSAGNSGLGQINTGTTIASGQLYRVVCTVSSTQTNTVQPLFELRAFPNDNSITAVRQDQPTGVNGAHMPDSGGKDYTVLLPSTGIDGQQLDISFDVLNQTAGHTGSMTWEKAVIQSIPLSSLP